MKYSYYKYFPGCSSAEGTAKGYGQSIRDISGPLGLALVELEDWNCCGSTPYGSTNELESLCIAARNLALAEKTTFTVLAERGIPADKTTLDLVTPCSSCYTTLNRVNSYLRQYPDVKAKVDECLAAAGLKYQGRVRARHLFEVIYNDVGLKFIESKVVSPLNGLKVAAYYGCQLVRPEPGFDNPHNPQSLDQLVSCLGGEPVPFPLKDRCCGGSLIIPELDLTLGLIHNILESAASNGAQCIVTPCPLCQTNLDAYQSMVNRKFKTNYNLPILFFTQLIGLAIIPKALPIVIPKYPISPEYLGLHTNVVSPNPVLNHLFMTRFYAAQRS
ncbi:CoB--CoM heterodisulfide reductase iron-sulfur subunit B family protein [Chloroflexota bacterium]